MRHGGNVLVYIGEYSLSRTPVVGYHFQFAIGYASIYAGASAFRCSLPPCVLLNIWCEGRPALRLRAYRLGRACHIDCTRAR